MANYTTLRARRIVSDPQVLTYTATADTSTELAPGLYVVTSDQDCYILQGGSGTTATTSSNVLWAKERAEIEVRFADGSDAYISAVQVSAGGNLWITRLEA